MGLSNWTPLVLRYPRRYIEESVVFSILDIDAWSDDFEYNADPWNGLYDFARPPRVTLKERTGDCEDYALVVASHLVSCYKPCELILLYHDDSYVADHVAVYDGERIYSSGQIYNKTPEEYTEWSKYDRFKSRKI